MLRAEIISIVQRVNSFPVLVTERAKQDASRLLVSLGLNEVKPVSARVDAALTV